MNNFCFKFLFLSFIFSILLSCENDLKHISSGVIEEMPVQWLKDAELIYSDSARVQMLLKAPLINRYKGEDEYNEFPKGIKAFFYNHKGEIKSFLTANYAIHFEKMKLMEAKNNVVFVNKENNETLNTEHLVWNEKRGIIYSENFVKITTKDEILIGEGFESDENFEKWVIKKPKGSFPIKVDKN